MTTIRLTMAQALIRYLAAQMSELDGLEVPLFAGVFAIFGHGNVAGIGDALYDTRERLSTLRAHNEQAMGLAAIGFAKASRRRRMMARCHQHGNRGGRRPCQSPAGTIIAWRCLCRAPTRPGLATARSVRRPDHLGQ